MSAQQKASSFLSSLKGGAAPAAAGPAASSDAVNALNAKLAALEKKLDEIAKASLPPGEGDPPKPPTELAMFLQSKLDLVESRYQTAQAEALRANLLLREREEAQRKAQKEVEQLFRSIREQTRSSAWDAQLRQRLLQLEEQLRRVSSGSIPAEEVLAALENDDLKLQLEKRVREKILGAPGAPAPAPQAPSTEDPSMVAALVGRLADVEQRLEAALKERDEERDRRRAWEAQLAGQVGGERVFDRAGGKQLLVEAALESSVEAFRAREELTLKLQALLKRIEAEPPQSPALFGLRAQLADLQKRMEQVQAALDKNVALVQSWVRQTKKP